VDDRVFEGALSDRGNTRILNGINANVTVEEDAMLANINDVSQLSLWRH